MSKPRVPAEKVSARKHLLRAQDVYRPPPFAPTRQPKKESAGRDGSGIGRGILGGSETVKKAGQRSTRQPPASARSERRRTVQKRSPLSARAARGVATADDLHQSGPAACTGGFAPSSAEHRLHAHWSPPREVGWRRQHSPPMGDYFDHDTHILHPQHLKLWDEERCASPARIWPSGPVSSSTLYDENRQGKPDWRPATPGEGHREFFGYPLEEDVLERPGCVLTQASRSRPHSATTTSGRSRLNSAATSSSGGSCGKKWHPVAGQAARPLVARPATAGPSRPRPQRS